MASIFSPEWRALGREGDLAAQQIAIGATAIGRANHAQTGTYTQAFFGLSIGLERLAKLIIIADYALEHSGRFPNDATMRGFGHDLSKLLVKCDELSLKYRSGKEFALRPNDVIHDNIIAILSEFARQTRYYNLDLVVQGKAAALADPIAAWWKEVAERILDRHVTGESRRQTAEHAQRLSLALEGAVSILHTAEEGTPITDFATFILRGKETVIVQTHSRVYCLQIVRWLAYLMYDLSIEAGYKRRIEPLFGLYERFQLFMQPDSVFRELKVWSLYK